MCVVSAVMRQWWPEQSKPWVLPTIQPGPNEIPWPTVQKDPELAWQMLEVLQKLEAIDKRLGLMEQCIVSEPEKENIKAKLREIADIVNAPE